MADMNDDVPFPGEDGDFFEGEEMDVLVSASDPSVAAAQAAVQVGEHYYCSMEQVLSPIIVVKGNIPTQMDPNGPGGFAAPSLSRLEDGPFFGGNIGAKGAVGPTLLELNPWFSQVSLDDGTNWFATCDFQMVVNNGKDPRYGKVGGELNIKKLGYQPEGGGDLEGTRQDVSIVRPMALRGPLVISGMGYDLSDQISYMSPNNRSLWPTGPVDLKWDIERMVWSGGHQIVCGYALVNEVIGPFGGPGGSTTITADTTPPTDGYTTFELNLIRYQRGAGRQVDEDGNVAGDGIPINVESTDYVVCHNRDPNLDMQETNEREIAFFVAIRINYEWIPLTHIQFDDAAIQASFAAASTERADFEERIAELEAE